MDTERHRQRGLRQALAAVAVIVALALGFAGGWYVRAALQLTPIEAGLHLLLPRDGFGPALEAYRLDAQALRQRAEAAEQSAERHRRSARQSAERSAALAERTRQIEARVPAPTIDEHLQAAEELVRQPVTPALEPCQVHVAALRDLGNDVRILEQVSALKSDEIDELTRQVSWRELEAADLQQAVAAERARAVAADRVIDRFKRSRRVNRVLGIATIGAAVAAVWAAK